MEINTKASSIQSVEAAHRPGQHAGEGIGVGTGHWSTAVPWAPGGGVVLKLSREDGLNSSLTSSPSYIGRAYYELRSIKFGRRSSC
jgi:hypothetical protein